MTITSTICSVSYLGDGASATFAVPFNFFGPDELAVYTVVGGAYSILTRGIHYNVTGGNDAAGNVIATGAPGVGTTLVIRRRTARTQQADYIDFDPFPASTTETALDRLTAQSQENDESIGRSLRAPIGEPALSQLPTAANRALKYLGWDALGNPASFTAPAGTTAVSSAMAAILASSTAAIALGLLNGMPVYNVIGLGAKGDNATNDYAVIQGALNTCFTNGGGIVYLPPTGHPYLIGTGLAVSNGTLLMGAGTWLFAGTNATLAQWAAQGSWLRCTDTVNPAVTLQGHGASVRGVNFIYAQPIPGGSFTPTTYPYAISMIVNYATIDNCFIFGATQGIQVLFTAVSGGGTGCRITNCIISAFRVGLQIINANDTMVFENLWIENQYYDTTLSVVNYLLANLIGIECHYCDNSDFTNIQIYQAFKGITFTDGTCLGNTHAAFNCSWTTIDFNNCVSAIGMSSTTATVSGQMTNILSQSDGTTGALMFGLNSDNVDLQISNLRVPVASSGVIVVGNGAAGRLLLSNFTCPNYSTITAGQPCLNANAGAVLNLANANITRHAGNGLTLSGVLFRSAAAGYWQPFYAAASSTSTGGTVNMGITSFFDPLAGGATQGRLHGTINVTTAIAAAVITLALSGIANVNATGIVASTTGIKAFDGGWIDFTQAVGGVIGAIQQAASAGVIADYSGVVFEWR